MAKTGPTDGGHDTTAATEPSRLARLRDYRRVHGGGALGRKLAQVGIRTLFKCAALATYYPTVGAEILRWKWRPPSTVLGTEEGELRFPGGRFATFLVHQPTQTPWYVQNALNALAEARINVLLVFNHPVEGERLAAFRRRSFRLMIRDNTGLDIGGYRDGYLALRAEETLERLLFLNDSVYYFESGLSSLFERLMSSRADLSAPYENRQFTYHIQSFCLSLSGDLARHPDVSRFFERYVPVSSRRWAIHRGEFGLSRALTGAARDIEIVYPIELLGENEDELPEAFRADPARFLPIALRRRFAWLREQAGATSESPLATALRLASPYSQIHTAGFLFRSMLGAPLVKRDLVYREQFTTDEARDLLTVTGHEGHLEEIVADLNRKGEGSRLRGMDQGRYVAGMI